LPNANVTGVNVVCANADHPGTRKESRRTVPPRNNSVRFFADLELALGQEREGRGKTNIGALPTSFQVLPVIFADPDSLGPPPAVL